MHIEYDDLFRMILVLTMAIGFTLSRSHLLNDMFYSFAQNLHLFLAIAFIFDLFRPKPPPHNGVSLAYFPGFFFWLLNKLIYYAHMYFSPQRLTIVKRIPLQGDYLVTDSETWYMFSSYLGITGKIRQLFKFHDKYHRTLFLD